MRAMRCAVAAVLVAGIVAVVGAQPARQPGGGGFGFGGGDLTSLVLSNEALQTELKVTAEQKEKLKPVTEKQTELNKKMRDAFGGGKFDKDKMADLREEGKKIGEEVKKAVEDTLTADQKKRIKQISIQQMGLGVFGEPREGKGGFGGTPEAQKVLMKEVVEAMKFTDGQKAKVKEIVDDYNKDRDAIRKDVFGDAKGGKAPDPEKTKDFTAKSGKLTEATWEKVTAALDDTQKKTWKELTGEPFDLAKLFQPRVQPKKD